MANQEPHLLEGTTTPLRGIRRAAARQMIAAWEAPAFHLTVEVDMTVALTVKTVTPDATVTDLLISVCAQALTDNPGINAHFGDEGVTTFSEVNIGIAVATDAGLTVPNLHGVEGLRLAEIASLRKAAVERARARRLSMADVTGGTFTISNLGMLGIDRFDAIINVPQVAILAVGSTKQRYVFREGAGEWRPVAELTLTCDHRAVDGATGAIFLSRIRELLEGPISG
jgi:pyruvate dehydrogenase E2 component (dihydrolipoamide acetyltransferase)